MEARIVLVFLAAFVVFQVLMWESHATVIRRDVSEQTAGQKIDEALQSFKNNLDDLLKNIQNNELYQNVSHSMKAFGEKVQEQSQNLVKKIQDAAKTD